MWAIFSRTQARISYVSYRFVLALMVVRTIKRVQSRIKKLARGRVTETENGYQRNTNEAYGKLAENVGYGSRENLSTKKSLYFKVTILRVICYHLVRCKRAIRAKGYVEYGLSESSPKLRTASISKALYSVLSYFVSIVYE